MNDTFRLQIELLIGMRGALLQWLVILHVKACIELFFQRSPDKKHPWGMSVVQACRPTGFAYSTT